MAKIVLEDTNSGYNLQTINNNFQKIETELNEKVLYRNNPVSEPNEMNNNLDMNSFRIYNLPTPVAEHEAARLKDVQDAISGAAEANLIGFSPYDYATSTNVQGAIQDVIDKLRTPQGSEVVGHIGESSEAIETTVQEKLRERISTRDFGILGNGTAADLARFQSALDFTASQNKWLYIEPGIYNQFGKLWLKPGTRLMADPGSVTLRVINGKDDAVIHQHPDIPLTHVYLSGIIFDGNHQNAPRLVAETVAGFNGIDHLDIRQCQFINGSGYGLGLQGRPVSTINPWMREWAKNVRIYDSIFRNNGVGIASGGDTHDGLDIKYVDKCVIIGCQFTGNSDKGLDIRGKNVFISGNYAGFNGGQNYGIATAYSDMGINVDGVINFDNNIADGGDAQSVYISEGAVSNLSKSLINVSNLIIKGSASSALRIEAPNVDLNISGCIIKTVNGHGIHIISCNTLSMSGLNIQGCLQNGIFSQSTRVVTISDIIATGNTQYAISSAGASIILDGASYIGDNGIGSISGNVNPLTSYASAIKSVSTPSISNTAALLEVPVGWDSFQLSSTVTIVDISAKIVGNELTIYCPTAVTFAQSGVIELITGSGSKTVAAGKVIRFKYVAAKWREI